MEAMKLKAKRDGFFAFVCHGNEIESLKDETISTDDVCW
jgi:hypothetical protein